MQDQNLPTDELKTFGIINDDLTFSKKLSTDDIQKFLQGYTIVADNDKNRATFQLTDNNTKLKVIFLERDKNLSEILRNSKYEIQYSTTFSNYGINEEKNAAQLNWTKAVFIFDEKKQKIIEYDMIKDAPIITQLIAEREKPEEVNRYKIELKKLQSFLQDKIDQYPEIAKGITENLNIVAKELNNVNSISPDEKQISKGGSSDIQLNVNDRDLYEDANRMREEQEEVGEIQKPRGFRR